MKSVSELFNQMLENTTDSVYCNLPCKVEKVNGNFVDVKVYINDEEPDLVLYNVPIQRQETQRAYIFLGIKQGDRGTLKFFDRSVEGYLGSNFDYNSDERQHNINDRAFELGFIPDKEAYVYPTDNEIEIGLKNNAFKISVDNEGSLIIKAIDAKIETQGLITIKAESGVMVKSPDMTFEGNVNIKTGASAVVPCGNTVLSFSNGILTGVS